jgi:hypothetical protein
MIMVMVMVMVMVVCYVPFLALHKGIVAGTWMMVVVVQ